ncbi:MAG: stage II sporulation protein M [Pseudomonadota bacterium]
MTEEHTEDVLLRSHRFRKEREADWRMLENLLDRVSSKSASALTDEEMLTLPRAYRSTLSSLSVARAISLDKNLVDYLENLCTRAYYFIYGSRSTLRERILQFLKRDWYVAAYTIWRETLVAAAITIVAAFVAYVLVTSDADWFYSFVPETYASERDPSSSTEALRDSLYHDGDDTGLSVFSTSLFTHNARIALFAFALGFAFCIPTVFLLAYNGCIIGAFFALFSSRDLGFEFGGWLLIHGVTELLAIVIAGGAGMRVGWAIANPGDLSRLDAAAQASRGAALALAGVVIMLFIAGLIEGFARQLITIDALRYTIAIASALFWGVYLYGRALGTRT